MCGLAAFAYAGRLTGQSEAGSAFVAPGYRPAAGTDERGIWSLMDREERDLKTSRFVIRDAELNSFVRDIVCRLGKDYCPDIRGYIVRTPHFNASMAPNGMMQVWTGLLLRCNDEAQLAAILGHEMGHFLRQHSIQRYRDARDKASFATFLGMGLAVAGAGGVRPLAELAIVASIFAYSRDQEREADQVGLELMTKAGYAPMAAPEVWGQLIAESKAGTATRSSAFLFATHPEPEERIGTLREAAEKADARDAERGHDRYRTKLAGIRRHIVADELALRQYGRSELVFERLLAQSPDDGLLWYAKGEVCRLRDGPDDAERARAAYDKAIAAGGAPPETYRSIMMVEMKAGARERAQGAFDTYVKLKPDASDAEILRTLLTQ
ncbi:MAG: M48 family metalloprotease [Burkholderiales bacterium]